MFFVLFFGVSEANVRYSFYRHEGGRTLERSRNQFFSQVSFNWKGLVSHKIYTNNLIFHKTMSIIRITNNLIFHKTMSIIRITFCHTQKPRTFPTKCT
jgi:hypothetical protein